MMLNRAAPASLAAKAPRPPKVARGAARSTIQPMLDRGWIVDRGLIVATEAGWAGLDFEVPPELEAAEPPEARGLARDGVRLMVSHYGDDRIVHAHFRELPDYLAPGDVLVINTSGTLKAALAAKREDGTPLELHLSTRLPDGRWVVELRRLVDNGTETLYTAAPGERIMLPATASALLQAPYATLSEGRVRLWIAQLALPEPALAFLDHHGFPIRYSYVKAPWPASYYQTVYATEVGSAEMPSAGRAFTPEVLMRLMARGVTVAPLLLHTGVASPEDYEPPYEEYYRVPAATARLVNSAREAGRRIVAVGTTVVRALESVADESGSVRAGEGRTDLVITPARGLRAVTGLLTGLHAPRASHLAMLAALAGYDHLRPTYADALRQRYLWHEFGDLHLILP
jgi:S-adenosylmethionine:tRNA ribosyltransferase-isomerase